VFCVVVSERSGTERPQHTILPVDESGRVVSLLAAMDETVLDWLHSSSEIFEIGLGDVLKKACSAGNFDVFE